MPEKEVINEVAQHGLFVQWFIDWYGWAFLAIGALASYIWASLSGRVKTLEEKVGKCQTKHACKEFRDGIKEDIEKSDVDCEKDIDRLGEVVKELREGMGKYIDRLETINREAMKEIKDSFGEVRASVSKLHGRVDKALLKNSKRSEE